jgi:hypothetical protein
MTPRAGDEKIYVYDTISCWSAAKSLAVVGANNAPSRLG